MAFLFNSNSESVVLLVLGAWDINLLTSAAMDLAVEKVLFPPAIPWRYAVKAL